MENLGKVLNITSNTIKDVPKSDVDYHREQLTIKEKVKSDVLSMEDYLIISMTVDLENPNFEYGFAEQDENIFIIRNNDEYWKRLCGREWHYNFKTKEIKLA